MTRSKGRAGDPSPAESAATEGTMPDSLVEKGLAAAVKGTAPGEDRLDWLSHQWNARRGDIDITPWQVWGRLTRIQEIFLASISRTLTEHHMNFKEFQTLGALVLSGPPYEANPNTIARFNLLTSGGLTNLLTRMERDGLITRHPDPSDGRGVIVRITDKGLEDFNAAIVEENAIEHELLGCLNAEERLILGTLLRKLLRGIDRAPINGTRQTTG
ncbi:MAG TPA: MarR family winged helix-turn-helix transcriptional regulator [Azospirillaceae bacterium]|nr:MarR family winged helix-turn-helix transcriptional regulator [Azospirillaceae bacterium]